MKDEYRNMTLLERVSKLRMRFAKKKIEATGAGKAFGRGDDGRDFAFLQLTDFIQQALIESDDLGLLPVISVENDRAVMTVMDILGKDQSLVLTCPSCKVLTNGQDLQGIGSQITYNRRYLWYQLLELCVHDEIDEGIWNKAADAAKNPDSAKAPEQDSQPAKQKEVAISIVPLKRDVASSAAAAPTSNAPAHNQGMMQKGKKEIEIEIRALKQYINAIPSFDRDSAYRELRRFNVSDQSISKNAGGRPLSEIDQIAMISVLNRAVKSMIRSRMQYLETCA